MMKNLLLSFALIAFLAVGVKAQTASVKLVVDMTYQLTTQISGTTIEQVSYSTQKFNPREDILDVAGSFNGWDGSNSLLSPVEGSDSTLWEITIPDLTVGEFIAFKIRIKGEWVEGHSEFWGDAPDRKYLVKDGENNYEAIFDNYYPGMVPVTVNVNMNARIAAGTFDAATQSVDLAGTFNEWDQTNLGYDDGYMFDNKYNQATDGIYRKVIIAPVGTMKWKARIHDASAIEWESRSDREFTVVDTVGGATNEITVWFNDIEDVKENNFSALSVYPNPTVNDLTIKNVANATVVELVNVVGKTVKVENVNSQDRVVISTSDLASGIYFVVVKDAANNSRTIKVVKQ